MNHPDFHAKITYNPIQLESAKYINDDCNILCLSPTSSGKTIVCEQFIFSAIEQGKKGIYLSPLKALTEEKKRSWESLFPITMVTGDHIQAHTFNTPLILMTTEALDSKTRGNPAWLKSVGCVAVDEAHLMSSPNRGDSLEIGLMRFTAINREARIVLLSATIPNAKDFAQWLTKLNGKPTQVIQSEWRPVEQEHHLVLAGDRPWDVIKKTKETVAKLSAQHPDKQMIIFVHTVGRGINLAKDLGCPFHYSKLTAEKRQAISEAFTHKKINRIVATSTLAYGVNLPADIVVISGATRGPTTVDPIDIKQEAGRAGRYGLSERGYSYYVFENFLGKEFYETCLQTPPVYSVLRDHLYFHIVSFVHREGMQREDIKAFCRRAFAEDLDVDAHIEKLQEAGVLYPGDNLAVTKIGKAAALMYIDPLDLVALYNNLKERPTDTVAIAKAFAMIPSNAYPCWIPEDIEEVAVECPFAKQTIDATCLAVWMSGKEAYGTFATLTPMLVRDVDRWASAMTIAGVNADYMKSISLMLTKGISYNLIELCQQKGIGRKKAMKLYEHGFKTLDDVLAKKVNAIALLGKKIVTDIENAKRNDGKVVLNF